MDAQLVGTLNKINDLAIFLIFGTIIGRSTEFSCLLLCLGTAELIAFCIDISCSEA